MLVKCPSCNKEYDCEPGRYLCTCGAEFTVPPDGMIAPGAPDVMNEMPDPVEGLPEYAQAALMRGMAKAPGDRFGSCTEFAAALRGERKTAVPVVPAVPVIRTVPVSKSAPAGKRSPAGKSFGSESKEKLLVAIALLLIFFIGFFVLYEVKRSSSAEKSKTIDLPEGVQLELVKVKSGSFTMSPFGGDSFTNEVKHRAELTKDFYIGRTEVTQAQWKAVMGNNPSRFEGDDLPVEQVTWNDAMEFCEKLNDMGMAPAGWKFSLPTETQWEYAARGGKKGKGFKYSGSNDIYEVA